MGEAALKADSGAIDLRAEFESAGIGEVLEKLDRELVGLAPVKSRIREIASLLLIERVRKRLELTGATKIWRRDASDLGPLGAGAGGPFGLVFLDPPYHKNLIPPALASLKKGGWLTDKALLVAETAQGESFDAPGFTMLDERDYGDTRMRFLSLAVIPA